MSLLQIGMVITAVFAGISYLFGWALCRASALADDRAQAVLERETHVVITEDEAPPLRKAA